MRGTSRPGRVRRTRRRLGTPLPPPPAAAEPVARNVRRTSLTGRAAVLAVVVCAVVVTLAYPMRLYVAQRGQIAGLRAQQAAQERRAAALEAEQRRWADPAYVRAQATKRLHYVVPGHPSTIVLGAPAPRTAPAPRPTSGPVPAPTTGPWYYRLWQSTVAAGTR